MELKMNKVCLVVLMFLMLPFLASEVSALIINSEKVFQQTDEMLLDGLIESSSNASEVNISIYNSTQTLLTTTTTSTGGDKNYFSKTVDLNESFSPGDYTITVSVLDESITLNISIVEEISQYRAHLISSEEVIVVDTSNVATSASHLGNDFSQIINLSKNNTIHYGSATVNETLLTFALVNKNDEELFDQIYISKGATFSTVWKIRKIGERITNDWVYSISDVEVFTGDKILIVPSAPDSSYSMADEVYIVGLLESPNGFQEDEEILLKLTDSEDNEIYSVTKTSNENGYFTTNLTAPNQTGTYNIYFNDVFSEIFSVESFKLYAKTTDLSGTPMSSFSESPKIKIEANVKDADDESVFDASVNATLTFPNGSQVSLGILNYDNVTGCYAKDISGSLLATPAGKYKVIISAESNGEAEEFTIGFSIDSVSITTMPFNPEFMEDAQDSEAMVDSFGPGSNASILVMLSNISKDAMMSEGPMGLNLVDLEDESGNCSERVKLLKVEDENGNSVSVTNLRILNLSSAASELSVGDDGPQAEMYNQCVILFTAPESTGNYKLKIKVTHPLAGELESGSSFNIDNYYATANSVDFKGDDFWFYAPNSTVRIKVKVTDLATQEEVSGNQMANAEIIEMYKVWPSFEDVYTDEYRSIANASFVNGTISFISPDSEGFFMVKFKFQIDDEGSIKEGTGTGFFMLKKYMIWGKTEGITPPGENVSLTINVIDIEQGALLDLDQTTGLSCTNCDGLQVDVSELWNDQMMRRLEEGVDYTIIKGSVYNSSASITVVPIGEGITSGWYHLDLILTDKVTNETYFGWAGFETRNFWVEVMSVEEDEGELFASSGMGDATYGVGENIIITPVAFDPSNMGEFGPEMLEITDVSLETLSLIRENGPPVDLEEGVDFNFTQSTANVYMEGSEAPVEVEMLNITLAENLGEYQAGISVETNEGSDIGAFWFSLSSYQVELSYRGMENWPATFANDEILEINVSAHDFDENPWQLSEESTRVKSVWSRSSDSPIKPSDEAVNVSCESNECTILLDLSQIVSRSGTYEVSLEIVDIEGNSKQEHIEFEVRGMVISIPNINEIFIDQQSDTKEREIEIWNDRDSCSNEKSLQTDGSSSVIEEQSSSYSLSISGDRTFYTEQAISLLLEESSCPEETQKVCVDSINYTFVSEVEGTKYAGAICILQNGLQYQGENSACHGAGGSLLYIVSNETSLWFNNSNVTALEAGYEIEMDISSPVSEGQALSVAGRNWQISENLANSFSYWDTALVQYSNSGNQKYFGVSDRYYNGVVAVYCLSSEGFSEWLGSCSVGENVTYFLSNGSALWVVVSDNNEIESPVDFTSAQILGIDDSFSVAGISWTLLKIAQREVCDPGCSWQADPNNMILVGDIVIDLKNYVNHFNCSASVDFSVNTTESYEKNYLGVYCILNDSYLVATSCNNGEAVDTITRNESYWVSGECPSESVGTTVYAFSNTTHVLLGESSDLSSATPLIQDDTITLGAIEWTIESVGMQGETTDPRMFEVSYQSESASNTVIFNDIEVTVAQKYDENYVALYCVNPETFEWRDTFSESCIEGNLAYVVSNGTHVWIGEGSDLSSESALAENSTFEFATADWKIVSVSDNALEIGNPDGICGRRNVCSEEGCYEERFTLNPPSGYTSYSTFYHGYVTNLVGNLEWSRESWFGEAFNLIRPVYLFHNTTHVWLSNSSNLSTVEPVAVGGVIADPYGGNWTVGTINRNTVTLLGANVLANTGAYVNTSLSKSGVFKIASVNEEWLGYWDKNNGDNKGIDLNDDDETNSTVYFAISDSQTAGVYDSFFYSEDSEFTNPIMVTDTRENRVFGDLDTLTLLSISPDAQKIRVYGENVGDWAELGELKTGSIVKLPIIVRTPAGQDTTANVTIEVIRSEIGANNNEYGQDDFAYTPATTITGIGELEVNLTQTIGIEESGKYTFGFSATDGSVEETIDQWRWPSVRIREFLVDSSSGDGVYLTGFKQLGVQKYNWESYGQLLEIWEENIESINQTIAGIVAYGRGSQIDECFGTFTKPADATGDSGSVMKLVNNEEIWAYVSENDAGKFWYRSGDCDFGNEASSVLENSELVLEIYENNYILNAIYINNSVGASEVVLGLANFNSSLIEPIRFDGGNGRWQMMNLNISGTPFNMVMANASIDYPMCDVWNCFECTRSVWISNDSDFSDAIQRFIGDNITGSYYLASLGPGPWEGITIVNGLNLSGLSLTQNPSFGINTKGDYVLFGEINETDLDNDFNIDNDTSDTFYLLAFEEREGDGISRIIVDDDLNITEEWWSDSNQETYYEFYGEESGVKERNGNLPSVIWSGNLVFNGEDEDQARWEIEFFNETDMLLRKSQDPWQNPFTTSEPVGFVLKVYEFDQTPIENASVTVERMMKFGYMGASILDNTSYVVEMTPDDSTTDTKGFVIIELSPDTAWDEGEYMLQFAITRDSSVERKTEWFRIVE